MHATFDHVHQESEHIATFFFRPEKPVQYTAGQFIELTLAHENADDRGDRRWFTLSSSPNAELISITTKLMPEGGSTFKNVLRALSRGAAVKISDPMGDFVLPKLIQTPLIFVAGGIGVTPFHSILSWLGETNEVRPINLLYAVDNEEEIIFQETFDKANVSATVVVNHATPAWGGERGLITAEKIIGLEKPSEDTLIYISGPEPMVEQLEKDLKKAGVLQHQLVLDFFPNYTAI